MSFDKALMDRLVRKASIQAANACRDRASYAEAIEYMADWFDQAHDMELQVLEAVSDVPAIITKSTSEEAA